MQYKSSASTRDSYKISFRFLRILLDFLRCSICKKVNSSEKNIKKVSQTIEFFWKKESNKQILYSKLIFSLHFFNCTTKTNNKKLKQKRVCRYLRTLHHGQKISHRFFFDFPEKKVYYNIVVFLVGQRRTLKSES